MRFARLCQGSGSEAAERKTERRNGRGTEGFGTEVRNGNGNGTETRNGSAAERTVLASTLEGCATPESLHRFRNSDGNGTGSTLETGLRDLDLWSRVDYTRYRSGSGNGNGNGILGRYPN